MPIISRQNNTNILNNLKDHVESGDVLFVVSGDVPNNQQAGEPSNERCLCRRKLDRNLHSKVVDALQFGAAFEALQSSEPSNERCRPNCLCRSKVDRNLNSKVVDAAGQVGSGKISVKRSASMVKLKGSGSTIEKPTRNTIEKKIRNRSKSRVQPPVDNYWRRKIILSQMKNHRISTATMDDGSRQKLM